jgi:hypothetical protein
MQKFRVQARLQEHMHKHGIQPTQPAGNDSRVMPAKGHVVVFALQGTYGDRLPSDLY